MGAEEFDKTEQQKSFFAAYDLVITLIEPYMSTLLVRRSQTCYKDHYGVQKLEKWHAEVEYFIDHVLVKNNEVCEFLYLTDAQLIKKNSSAQMSEAIQANQALRREALRDLIEFRVDKEVVQPSDVQHLVNAEDLDPIDFEHHCAEILRGAGWDARITKGSGDQGVDIIATLGATKAVFQCKKYSQPVGNSAVQEIISGKIFEQALLAAVVSNNSYTASARQLAAALNVHLLHYSELRTFMEELKVN